MSNSVTTNPPAARPTASPIAVGRTGREREKYLEEQLRLVTNHGPVYLVHCDREHRYTFANRAYAERYALTTQSIIGKHVSEVAGSAAYNSFRHHMDAALAGQRVEFEMEIPYESLGARWMHVIYEPAHLSGGEIAGFVGVISDVTPRKEAELALQEKKQRLNAALSAASTGTFVWNLKTNVLEWDESLDRLFGFPPGQTVQSFDQFIAVVHPEDRQGVVAHCERCAREGEDFEMEFRTVWPDGSVHWLYDKGKTFLDQAGNPDYMAGACVDITQRKQQQEVLAELSRKIEDQARIFDTALSHITDFAYTFDRQGRFIYVNKPLLDLWGLPLVQAVGKNFFDLQYPAPLAERLQRQIQQVIETKSMVKDETLYVSPSGDEGYYEYIFSPVFAANGTVEVVAGSTRVITERKRTEAMLRKVQEQLASSNVELEKRVRERTAELTDSNNQLETLVYSIAHDLRAPLRSMQAFSKLIVEEHSAGLDPVAQKYAQRIVTSSITMDALLLDLLHYGRIMRADMLLDAVSVESAWEAATLQHEKEIREKQAQIDATLPLPRVRAHEATLGQVLANLLGNALKFVPAGTRPHIQFRAEERQNWVRLWVNDNGIGIAPQYHDRIFRVFEQLNGKDYGGTGIGLSIVRKGIERMQGRVGVESAPGQGTRFWIELQKAE